jgi:hypothetical protein
MPSPLVLSKLLDGLLPDRLSYRPKRRGSSTEVGFRERGYADVTAYGWEEFIWKGRPFGFHVRGQQVVNRVPEREIATLRQVVADLTQGEPRTHGAGTD